MKFDKNVPEKIILSTFTLGKMDISSTKSVIKRNNIEFKVSKENLEADSNNCDGKSVLISVSNYIEFSLK